MLLDVGVWLAAVWGRHIHHPVVRTWFDKRTLRNGNVVRKYLTGDSHVA